MNGILIDNTPKESSAAAGMLRASWSRGRPCERATYVISAVLIVSGVAHLAVHLITNGSWAGPVSLRKPTTFGLSFGVTLMTITWVSSFVLLSNRARALLLGAFTAACVLETALVSLQAWRGVPSHFNVETTFDASVARLLAAGGLVLVAVILLLALASFRRNPVVPVSLLTAIRIGFVALVASVFVGALMIARGMTLVFGGEPQAAYATGGALKPTHAVTMHAILVLPALAWVLSFMNWKEERRLYAVLLAALVYVVLAGMVAAGDFAGLGAEPPSSRR